MERSIINDANAPNPIGSYNQAVVANGLYLLLDKLLLIHQMEN